MTSWLLYGLGSLVIMYGLIVLAFVILGRREDARAIGGFVPDCVVLFSRLVREERLPRRHKLLVAALIPYLAMPFDLIPDFVRVAGQLDDAILVALVLRRVAQKNPDLAGSAGQVPQPHSLSSSDLPDTTSDLARRAAASGLA